MSPDQEQSDLSPYCLKSTSAEGKQTTVVMNDRKGVKKE